MRVSYVCEIFPEFKFAIVCLHKYGESIHTNDNLDITKYLIV